MRKTRPASCVLRPEEMSVANILYSAIIDIEYSGIRHGRCDDY